METFISLAPFPVLRLFPNFLFVNFFKFQYWKTTNCFKSFSINTTCLATKQTYQDNPFDVHSYQLNMCFVCSGLDEKQIARIFLSDVFTGKRNSKTTSCFPEASSKSVNWLWMLLIVLKLPSPPPLSEYCTVDVILLTAPLSSQISKMENLFCGGRMLWLLLACLHVSQWCVNANSRLID